MHFLSWLTEIEDSDWTHVDNQWIVNQLMEKYNAKTNLEKSSKQALDGPHYESQHWIGARSYVSTVNKSLHWIL